MRHCATCTCQTHATATESKVLSCLQENAGKTLTRTAIVKAVWGTDYLGLTNVVDVYIHTLRTKYHLPIKTVRGIGYTLAQEVPA